MGFFPPKHESWVSELSFGVLESQGIAILSSLFHVEEGQQSDNRAPSKGFSTVWVSLNWGKLSLFIMIYVKRETIEP